ncbi:TIR domain-containing protein [Serratia sp. JSRIV004]|uniref:TIR domain-containing protein n=1 Tax=Serratia sp. JSRIV004 TaxID=2831895 RepID=UPI0035301C2D|nr:TIR domain-containing protein [Serratia sp. JSRIV004]
MGVKTLLEEQSHNRYLHEPRRNYQWFEMCSSVSTLLTTFSAPSRCAICSGELILATANEWEEFKRKGDTAIERWIDDSLVGKSCVVVLVGSETATCP